MGRRSRLQKITDYQTRFRCAGAIGMLHEEVWVDEDGKTARYNLAFLLPHLFSKDNGRILGHDNAHVEDERHWMGTVKRFDFKGYAATARRFYREVEAIRRKYENQGI